MVYSIYILSYGLMDFEQDVPFILHYQGCRQAGKYLWDHVEIDYQVIGF